MTEVNQKVALITGCSGMDASYLAELLLSKGYTVHGMIRRSSSINTQRIDHLYKDPHLEGVKFFLHYGDMSDQSSIEGIIQKVRPDEVYNLAAMSHVRVSFDMPEYTGDVDGLGTLRVLEAIRKLDKKVKFYQAGTSEMYGGVYEKAQNEDTPFYPRSPYAVAKLYAHWITKNYREAYGMFAVNGILFNHASVPGFTPIIFKIGNQVDIKPINEVVKYHTGNQLVDESIEKYQDGEVVSPLAIWDNNKWEQVTYASGYPNSIKGDKPRYIISKKSAYMTTQDHVVIMKDGTEKKCADISVGDEVYLVKFPNSFPEEDISVSEAELLGLVVGDGHVGHNRGSFCFANKSPTYLNRSIDLWSEIGLQYGKKCDTSIYTSANQVRKVTFNGFPGWIRRYSVYTDDRKKRVPVQILNASKDVQLAFLRGYNQADGLKLNKCVYEFKNFKTNSPVLAQGLLYLLSNTTKQDYNINIEIGRKGELYYSLNILSNSRFSLSKSSEKKDTVLELLEAGVSQRQMCRDTGISRTFIRKVQNGYEPTGQHHLARTCDNTAKKVIEFPDYNGWLYDLTTASGKFHCGVGQGRIHNSPRRGETFVEQKIVQGAVAIAQGKQDCLYLGNLYSHRDFGHSKDFVRAMWLMLQQEEPDDYVIASGEKVMIKDIVNRVFQKLGAPLEWHGEGLEEYANLDDQIVVKIDKRYFRPSEVDTLLGDASKAREKLGWKPEYVFDGILDEMITEELKKY